MLSAQSAPFDEDVRPDCENGFERRVFIEGANVVHHVQARKESRRARLLEIPDACGPFNRRTEAIAVDRNDQSVAQSARSRQQIEMPGMEHIEAAVGENDLLAGGLEAARLLCDGITRMDRHVWTFRA